jgi:predicted O-methyltransferase YrrM
VPEGLAEYIRGLFVQEDPDVVKMREEALREGIPGIQVPWELGRLLQLLILAKKATKVLEIGSLFGYSSIVMARALPEGGEITTLEVNPKHAQAARRNIERAGMTERVRVLEGPALDTLRSLAGETFNVVFIDADKQTYPQYLESSLALVAPGSFIVADNVWRGGSVTTTNRATPEDLGVARFAQALAANDRLVTTIIPRLDFSDAASVSAVIA